MKLKGIGNNIIQVVEVQDSRFWIHSFELGYGKWVTNKELLDLIKSKAVNHDNHEQKSEEYKQ